MLRAFVLLLAISVPTVALAQPHPEIPEEQLYRCKNTQGDVAVTFKPEIEVRELVSWAVGFTCKEFIFEPRIVKSRTVTIIAPNKLSRADAWKMFLAAMKTVNYAVVPRGGSLAIVDAPTARRENIKLTRQPDGSEQFVRYVYRPEHATAESLVQAFTLLKSEAGEVQQVSTMLLVTDYASHVKEMIGLARLVDVPKGTEGIYLIPMKFTDAKKVAEYLPGLLWPQAATGAGKPDARLSPAPSKIIAEERTNTLVMAATQASYDRAKAFVDTIDIELEIEGGAKFHVYRLQSAIAEELAKTLNDTLGQNRGAQPGVPRPNAPQPAPTAPDAGATIDGQVRIMSDKSTNSLIVMSTGRDYLAIKDLIRELDQPRRQVYIEALIMEVSAKSYMELGASMHGGVPGGNGLLVGGLQLPNLRSTDVKTLAGATGLIAGLIGKDLPGSQALFGTSIPSYGLLLQAIGGAELGHGVERTWMLGIDNKENKQSVGISQPVQEGQIQGFGADPSAVQTRFAQKKMPHELAITPHISGDDSVLLEVKHTAEQLIQETPNGPKTSFRDITTTVVVRDQTTVVIGGLAQQHQSFFETKVPLLGDIPLLGRLFKYTKKESRKTHLLIMLTPYIIKSHGDLQAIHERKLREYQELASSFKFLDGSKYVPKVDYGRKRGLVEEINRTLIEVDADIAAREQVRQLPRVRPGPIQPERE